VLTAVSFLPDQQAPERAKVIQDATARCQVLLELFQLVTHELKCIDASRKAAVSGFGDVLFDLTFDVVYLL
jgi:hypothetical protein